MSLAADLADALDPCRLFRRAWGEPDGWQAKALTSPARRALWNASRQSGKSTVAATLAVHEALYRPPALVLLLSPTLRQSSELYRKCAATYRAAGRPVPSEAETKLSLELENGSRIVSLPGSETTVRGYSAVRLLVVDEASRVEDGYYQSIRPMLAVSGGRLIALATPWGARGWWHREWTEGGDSWERVKVPAAECPRISAAFLDEERRSLSPLAFASEYECQFTDTEASVFGYDLVRRALSNEVEPLFPAVPFGGRLSAIAADVPPLPWVN